MKMNLIRFLETKSRAFVMIIAMGAVVLIGSIDYATGLEYSFIPAYLIAVFAATWSGGFWAGLLASLASAAVWFAEDAMLTGAFSLPMWLYWTSAAEFVLFITIVYVLAELRKALMRQK